MDVKAVQDWTSVVSLASDSQVGQGGRGASVEIRVWAGAKVNLPGLVAFALPQPIGELLESSSRAAVSRHRQPKTASPALATSMSCV